MPKHSPALKQVPFQGLRHLAATVKSVSGDSCAVDIDGAIYSCAIATHILSLAPGQRVAVLDGGPDGAYLVIAAWPANGSTVRPLQFDAATGTVHIESARLHLGALASIELQCGDAQLRLTLDGRLHMEGQDIVSAAIGSNRIEGATIDLN